MHASRSGPSAGAAFGAALDALAPLPAAVQLDLGAARLAGAPGGPLAEFEVGREDAPDPARLDGRLLELLCARALAGAQGAVFTGDPEATILTAFGLAEAAAQRGVPAADAVAILLGHAPPTPALAGALEGLRVLDPACGGGALLVRAELLARRAGARLALRGLDLSPLAAQATRDRLTLLGAAPDVRAADAALAPWPEADLVLGNPPFLRHERLSPTVKSAAALRSGLSRQADLAAHLASIALSHAATVALVLPRAIGSSRSTAPLLAAARARGGFALWLRSRTAGSFAASVDTALTVWSLGHPGRAPVEATLPLGALTAAELTGLARGIHGPRLRATSSVTTARPRAGRLDDLCRVRFGMKSGANGFFHLAPHGAGADRFVSALAGEVRLAPGDVAPLLASLKEARAPEDVSPARVLFRPAGDGASARAYVELGERLGVHLRPTCAGRSPWWLVAPGRAPAPVLYPAKIGARAFAVLNGRGLLEDKKWHALFPCAEVEPWLVATLLGATPIRLAIDLAARQLTGAQAIADVDCRVLAAAPFPAARALAALAPALAPLRAALAEDPVTTDLAAMLDRPAQRELDLVAGRALGIGPRAVASGREALTARVAARLEHADQVRAAVSGAG